MLISGFFLKLAQGLNVPSQKHSGYIRVMFLKENLQVHIGVTKINKPIRCRIGFLCSGLARQSVWRGYEQMGLYS